MLIAVGLLSLLIWPLFGAAPALLLFSAALAFALYRERSELRRLTRWLATPALETIPDPDGAWSEPYVLLSRALRAQRKHERSLSAALERFRLAGAAIPDDEEFDGILADRRQCRYRG